MSRIEDLTHLNCPISRKQIILQTINVHKLSFFENKDTDWKAFTMIIAEIEMKGQQWIERPDG